MVAAQQQQLRAICAVDYAFLFQQQQQTVPEEFLFEKQTIHREAKQRRTRGVHSSRQRSAAGKSSRVAAHVTSARLRNSSRRCRLYSERKSCRKETRGKTSSESCSLSCSSQQSFAC